MLTKEECLSALDYLCACACELADLKLEDWQSHNQYEVSMLERLINEHFDNPPLKFEELKEGMWVWDNLFKRYNKIVETSVHMFETTYLITFEYVHEPTRWKTIKFEENRFYRKQVED